MAAISAEHCYTEKGTGDRLSVIGLLRAILFLDSEHFQGLFVDYAEQSHDGKYWMRDAITWRMPESS